MSVYPNLERKQPGCFVRNVHPCGRYDDGGIVLYVGTCNEPDDTLTVATGPHGSTCYGPACNWAPTMSAPRWHQRNDVV